MGGLVIKETKFPERFFRRRFPELPVPSARVGEPRRQPQRRREGGGGDEGYGYFDFSLLHSHAIWHIAVIVLQSYYCAIYMRFLDGILRAAAM